MTTAYVQLWELELVAGRARTDRPATPLEELLEIVRQHDGSPLRLHPFQQRALDAYFPAGRPARPELERVRREFARIRRPR